MKKSISRIVIFLIILAIVLFGFCHIFSFKDSCGPSQMKAFYEQKDDTVDVIFLGSSHTFVNYNNATLWNEYGIASYDLAASNQPIWNSYYFLKEALKTQKPELIVLDCYSVVFDTEYFDESVTIKSTAGMRWSRNKVDAIKTGVEDSKKSEYLLEYSQYHTRYSALGKGDFVDDIGSEGLGYDWFNDDWKGQYLFNGSNSIEIGALETIDYKTELYPKAEEYLRKIIELAKEKDIPIALVITPYSATAEEQSKFNTVCDIANECGVQFIDCNLRLDEIGLDLETDYHDECHMTAAGSAKFSSYIGKVLKENYDISDRRGDSKYDSWERNAEYVEQYITDGRLKNSTDLDEIASFLQDSNMMTVIMADGTFEFANEGLQRFLSSQGVPDNTMGIWYKEGDDILWSATGESDEKYVDTGDHDFHLIHSSEDGLNQIIIDNIPYRAVNGGVNVVVFDKKTRIIVGVFGIDPDQEYAVVR